MAKLFANSGGPYHTPHAASDLCLHCLPVTFLGFSRLKEGPSAIFNWADSFGKVI